MVCVAVLVVVLVGASVAYRKYIANEVPPTPPEDVSPLTRAARADLYGDAVNEAAFMRPGQVLTRALVHADNGIDAVVDGVGELDRRRIDAVSATADGLRAVVRVGDVRGSRSRRTDGGGSVTTPWLTVLWVLPMLGAIVVALVPAARPTAARSVAVGFAAGTLAVSVALAVSFDSGGDRYQFVED